MDTRDLLEELTLSIGDQLAVLAVKIHDHDLAAKVEVVKSKLDRMADSDLVQTAKRISAAAGANATVLASDYLITPADLTAFENAIGAFDGMKTAPRDATVNRKVATLALPEAIAFVRGIYRNELDRLMTRFKKTQPDFFAAYTSARIIVDRAATRKPKPGTPPGGAATPPPVTP